MKHITISKLKKELLVVEAPQSWGLVIGEEALLIYDHTNKPFGKTHSFKGSYTLLGSPDEIREEDAEEIIDTTTAFSQDGADYLMWKNYADESDFCVTAKESLLSALESEIYWDVNPLGEKYDVELIASHKSEIAGKHLIELWNEAELRTFDRKRSIIFKKN